MNLSEKNIVKIWDEKNNFSVLPERWWILFSLILDWKELLFQEMLDETLFDESKNVRWWIPIMFPNAWAFTDENFEKFWFSLPQHWIARINSFEVFEKWNDFLTLRFDEKMQKTEEKFPYKFEIFVTYKIQKKSLKIFFKVKNNDEKYFSFSHWFHPYFAVFDWKKDEIIWSDEKNLKNNSVLYFPEEKLRFEEKIEENKNFSEIILKNFEIWKNDWTLSLDFFENNFSFEIKEIWKINLKVSNEFKKFWIRSNEKNKNFVCVEPVVWNVWNISKNWIILKKWEINESFFEIELI